MAKASKGGHVRALYYLGVAWSEGLGVKADKDKAIRCWMRAADSGDVEVRVGFGSVGFGSVEFRGVEFGGVGFSGVDFSGV